MEVHANHEVGKKPNGTMIWWKDLIETQSALDEENCGNGPSSVEIRRNDSIMDMTPPKDPLSPYYDALLQSLNKKCMEQHLLSKQH